MQAHLKFCALAAVVAASLCACAAPTDEARVAEYLREHPDWLNHHPELLDAAAKAAEQRQSIEARGRVRAVLAQHRDLLDDPLAPRLGATGGDVRIIEFSDYRCPPCRTSWPALHRLLDHEAGVELQVLPMPLFGTESEFGARVASAAQLQRAFAPLHAWLMAAPVIDRRSVLEAAASFGLDAERLLDDLDDPRHERLVEQSAQLAAALGIEGVPAFIVGDLLIRGGVDDAVLDKAVRLARSRPGT